MVSIFVSRQPLLTFMWGKSCNIAMKILDPNLRDGLHEWRDGKRFVKEGDKLYLEGTNTLAGRCGCCLFRKESYL